MTSRRNMKLTLAAMTLASSMILVDQTAVPLAAPHAILDLHAAISKSQWLMTANILPLAALMVFGGRLGDLFGMRRVFLVGAVIFALATTAMGASQDIAWAIAARAVQGCGAALMMPTALAIVSAVYPDEEKGSALGILAGASAFFAALGPVLGGVLTAIDWRLVFLVNVPLAVIAIALTLKATPGTRARSRRLARTRPARRRHLRGRRRPADLRPQRRARRRAGERPGRSSRSPSACS